MSKLYVRISVGRNYNYVGNTVFSIYTVIHLSVCLWICMAIRCGKLHRKGFSARFRYVYGFFYLGTVVLH